MVTYPLAAKLFEGFSILRWNDKLCPVKFAEIEHHAFKSAVSYFLGKALKDSKKTVDWMKIASGNVFFLMRKISTSDIHSYMCAEIKKDAAAYKALNEMICSGWSKPFLRLPERVLEDFKQFMYMNEPDSAEMDILKFAHKYATNCEFQIVAQSNSGDPDIPGIKIELDDDLSRVCTSLNFQGNDNDMVQRIRKHDVDEGINRILQLIDRLRYQIRWAQTPRVPETSVLGHCMYTAALAYFISMEAGLPDHRVVNNFFAALFHDLPEALTRDVISPVKNASEDIKRVISKTERALSEEKIIKHLPEPWLKDFRFITGLIAKKELEELPGAEQAVFARDEEFSNRYVDEQGKCRFVERGEKGKKPYPMEAHKDAPGVDGYLLKICDSLAAYMEAHMSVHYGLLSPSLQQGLSHTRSFCKDARMYGLKADDFFDGIVF
ncbi:MAG: HD domain-containing protein [Treponema sp.]|jgi:putative hydrolase of HD superfamily|nr:HD domain-containing protein [Treponema sp.]